MNYSVKSLAYSIFMCGAVLFLCGRLPLSAQDAAPSAADGRDALEQYEDSQVPLDFSDAEDTAAPGGSGSSQSGLWILVRMLIVLAIIIVAIIFIFRFMRRSMGVEPARADDDVFLRKVSSVSLGGTKAVQIVSLWDKAFVLGVSDNSVTLISEIDDKELVDAMNRYADMNGSKQKPRNFEELLNLFTKGGEQKQKPRDASRKSAYGEETMGLINSLKSKISGAESASRAGGDEVGSAAPDVGGATDAK